MSRWIRLQANRGNKFSWRQNEATVLFLEVMWGKFVIFNLYCIYATKYSHPFLLFSKQPLGILMQNLAHLLNGHT